MQKHRFTALSDFRFGLAGFLRFSERAATDAGLTPTQYLLLLHLAGFPNRAWATVGELAQRLIASHQATVALVKRCQARRFVVKRPNATDARCVEIHLTASGKLIVERIAARHRNELKRLQEAIKHAASHKSRATPRRTAKKGS